MEIDENEEMLLVDEACAIIQIENPHLDPDLHWYKIKEMAIAMVVSNYG
jgi:cytochrome oxidase assembly protein ShyY1